MAGNDNSEIERKLAGTWESEKSREMGKKRKAKNQIVNVWDHTMMARENFEISLASNFHHQIKSFNLHLTIPTKQKQKKVTAKAMMLLYQHFFPRPLLLL